MRRLPRHPGFSLLALIIAAPAQGIVAPAGVVGSHATAAVHVRADDASRQRRLSEAATWRAYLAENGPWTVLWNEATGTPHRAYGRGVALAGFADGPGAVDRAVRGFIAGHPGLFGGSPALELAAAQRADKVWYVRYHQTVGGLPVLFTDWEFRVGVNGKLFAFGADALPLDAAVLQAPRIPAVVAREAAKTGLPFNPATDRVEGGDALYVLPHQGETAREARVVYDVRVITTVPPGNWINLVDAATGEVLWRYDRVRYVIMGRVTGQVHPFLPTDSLVTASLAHAGVQVGAATAMTDFLGTYRAQPPAGTGASVPLGTQLLGPYCNVNRADGADAAFAATTSDPSRVDIDWDAANSQDAERDAFYYVNVAHDCTKSIDPGFSGNDYPMSCDVNVAQTCNAYWDGSGVHFFAAGGGCPNTATMPDVVYHEYGHAVNDNLYRQAGSVLGMVNASLHEGTADVNAALIEDNPDVGKGFYGRGTRLRSLSNTNRWPSDASDDPHVTGLIIGGAFWDLRQAVGLSVARRLSHYAKYGLPDDLDAGVAMHEYFIETLVADDDDGDLSNGTPHSAAIISAFNAHGIGSSFGLQIAHTPLADQSGGRDYPVTAVIRATGVLGNLDTSSPAVHYSVDNGPFVSVPMPGTGNPDEFAGSIPHQPHAIVRYYVSASDIYGGMVTDPADAPAHKVHAFIAGSTTVVINWDEETDAGWSLSDYYDTANTGRWIRADPVGTWDGVQIQPEDDHTPDPGVQCFVTGNAQPGDPVGTNDVDNGRTTLTTPIFHADQLTDPIISYYRWYSNNVGAAPSTDYWRTFISNDYGYHWVPVEATTETDNSWRRVCFRISDYVEPSFEMRMRFVASDEGDPSLVEAAVDDFTLLQFAEPIAVDGDAPAAFALKPPSPNPLRGGTVLAYVLPREGAVALRIYDVNGRVQRTLESGTRPAGGHRVAWDARDDVGRALPSGSYFARLDFAGLHATRTLTLIR